MARSVPEVCLDHGRRADTVRSGHSILSHVVLGLRFMACSRKIYSMVARDWQGAPDHKELPHSVFPVHSGVQHTLFCTIVWAGAFTYKRL